MRLWERHGTTAGVRGDGVRGTVGRCIDRPGRGPWTSLPSTSARRPLPQVSNTAAEIALMEDEIQKTTTPAYRAPEVTRLRDLLRPCSGLARMHC